VLFERSRALSMRTQDGRCAGNPERRTTYGIWSKSVPLELSDGARNALFAMCAIGSALCASAQVAGSLDYWSAPTSCPGLAGQLLVEVVCALALVACSYLLFEKTGGLPLVSRFLPAMTLVVVALLGISAYELARPGSVWTAAVLEVVRSLAFLSSCVTLGTLFDVMRVPSLRVAGIPLVVYAAGALVWSALINTSVMGFLLVCAAVYVLLVATTLVFVATTRSLDRVLFSLPALSGGAQEGSAAAGDSVGHPAQAVLADALAGRIEALAAEAGLTPRETEVFALTARGCSRSQVTEALVLSEGTVKTHIDHIYRKLGVHTRKELMELVLAPQNTR
jgi:DNA-binding CsgD family transcriptional regulator